MDTYPVCDAANKQVLWALSFTPDSGADKTISVFRSSITGSTIQAVTSFPLLAGATAGSTHGFAVGRTDRLFFIRTTGSTVSVYSVATTTNAAPVLLATGAVAGPVDISYARLYANDSLLAWSIGTASYRMPLPNGVGTSVPPTFYGGSIDSGIMDNHHFYGILQSSPYFSWCSLPSCSPKLLTSSMSSAYAFAQDAGARLQMS